MTLLTREQLRSIELRVEVVEIPEWGGAVRIREMTGSQRDSYEAHITGGRVGQRNPQYELRDARAQLVARCLIDAEGNLLYDWRKPEDIKELGRLPGAGIDRVCTRIQKLCKITVRDQRELMGNLSSAPNGDSGSD